MTTPLQAQTEVNETAQDSEAAAPRSIRDLREALQADITADEREQVFAELALLGADGDIRALMTLANALQSAGEVDRAIPVYEAAAELGEAAADVALMRIFSDQNSPFYDQARAAALMVRAAEAGNVGAQMALARALLSGDGMDADPARARQILTGVASESATAAQQAGNLALEGVGGPVDGAEAARLFRLAAEAGREASWLSLGSLLLNGEVVASDPAGALEAYLNAAESTNEQIAERARSALLNGHVTGAFGPLSDMSQVAALASGPLNDGNFGVARLVVSRAPQAVPAEVLSQALDVLDQAAQDGDQSAATVLFSHWVNARATNPAAADRELLRIVDTHADVLPERITLGFKIDSVAPRARTSAQYEELSSLLLNASPESLPSTLVRLRQRNPNAYVHALQSFLAAQGYYTGPKNGLLTGTTITAVSRFCAASGISRECALGPMRGNVARSIGTALAQR